MADETLRVVQLNAGSLLEPGWLDRRDEIVAWLRHLQPDVACFQEIWQDDRTPNTAGWLAEQTQEMGWHWAFEGRPFSSQLWPDPGLQFGSAVLSRWPIDYVFVGDPFLRLAGAGRVLSAQLAFHEPLTGALASDHAGLVVDIVWPHRPA